MPKINYDKQPFRLCKWNSKMRIPKDPNQLRRPTKEAEYWLLIIHELQPDHDETRLIELVNEVHELRYIFASILKKTLKKDHKLNN